MIALGGCIQNVSLDVEGPKWISWSEAKNLNPGQSMSEVNTILGEPVFNEYYEDQQMLSLYYIYRMQYYPIKKYLMKPAKPGYEATYSDAFIYERAQGTPTNHSFGILLRINMIYNTGKKDYYLHDWYVMPTQEKIGESKL